MLITFIKLMWKNRGKICRFGAEKYKDPVRTDRWFPGRASPLSAILQKWRGGLRCSFSLDCWLGPGSLCRSPHCSLEFSVQVLLTLQRRHWRPQGLLSGPGQPCWKMGTPWVSQRTPGGEGWEWGVWVLAFSQTPPTPRPAQDPAESVDGWRDCPEVSEPLNSHKEAA